MKSTFLAILILISFSASAQKQAPAYHIDSAKAAILEQKLSVNMAFLFALVDKCNEDLTAIGYISSETTGMLNVCNDRIKAITAGLDWYYTKKGDKTGQEAIKNHVLTAFRVLKPLKTAINVAKNG